MKTIRFTSLLLQINPVIIKKINFKKINDNTCYYSTKSYQRFKLRKMQSLIQTTCKEKYIHNSTIFSSIALTIRMRSKDLPK